MKRNVSPAFAMIVILCALIVGTLYFMHRYRKDAYLLAQQRAQLAARRMEGIRSGRMAAQEEQQFARQGRRAASPGKPGPPPGAPKAGEKAANAKGSDTPAAGESQSQRRGDQ